MNPTNDSELFNIFGTSLKAGKTKVACKLCFDEAYKALDLEEEANVRNVVYRILLGPGEKSFSKSPLVFYFGLK